MNLFPMTIVSVLGCQFSSIDRPQKRDVILIVVDTLRADRVGFYGNVKNQTTPNVDALAKNGLMYTQAYAQSGWTLPSFASLLTGLYPFEHRVVRSPDNEDIFGKLSDKIPTMASLFQNHGYQTAAVVNNTFLAPQFGLDRGFRDYFYQGADNDSLRSASETTGIALDWVEKQSKDTHIFLMVHYMEPHLTLNPPQEVKGRFSNDNKIIHAPFGARDAFDWRLEEKRAQNPEFVDEVLNLYDEEIFAVDVAIGNLLQGLQKMGRKEDALIVFTSDHGEEFWEQGGFEHGHHLYGVLTRVPLIIDGPSLKNLGKQETVVEHVDLFHSILTYVGVTPPKDTRGEDLFAMARKGENEERWIFGENTLYGDPMMSITTKDSRLILNQNTKQATLWHTKDGYETVPFVQEQQNIRSKPLLRGIKVIRGNIEPITNIESVMLPDQEMFQQLKSLGYIDDNK